MSRPRISIAGLMSIILYFAVGIAALRNANAFWASATFSLAIVSVSAAIVLASSRKTKGRMFWAAFAIAGGARLAIWLSTIQLVGFLQGPPRPLLSLLQPYINPTASSGGPYIAYTQTCNSLDIILLGLAAAVLASIMAPKDDQTNS